MVTTEGIVIKPKQVKGSNVLEMRAKKTTSGAVPEEYLINSLKAEFKPTNFQFGKNTFKLDWSGMKHILERHHPKFWNGTVKDKQSYFDAKTSIEEMQNVITSVLKQNRQILTQRRTNEVFKVTGEYNGTKYTLGINNGRVRQLYIPLDK